MKIVKGNKKVSAGDARNRIISKNRLHIKDARDALVKKAKTTDAREKLEKIRNLKKGKLDVKKSANGGITITTTKTGKILLTTSKKKNPAPQGNGVAKTILKKKKEVRPIKNLTNNVRVRPTVKPKQQQQQRPAKQVPLTRTIRGHMTESARLDYELMTTRVDPVILKRTVRQNIARERSPIDEARFYRPMSRRSPEMDYYDSRSRQSRLRSPLTTRSGRYASSRLPMERHDRSRSPYEYVPTQFNSSRRNRYDFDETRRDSHNHSHNNNHMHRDDEIRHRRMYKPEDNNRIYPGSGGRQVNDNMSNNYVSPLQGAKVIVSNLHNAVTQEDIVELFGDVGPLKRVKVSSPGAAEVVFVNKEDAMKAVETYHNRQLDGKAMKCQLIGSKPNMDYATVVKDNYRRNVLRMGHFN
ncbi:uncharacterized protein [Lepeophtheirus salmonis]|nr:uncharacterized protein LOC121116615 isoform X2 [Lepeophtheirus salmonis]